MIRKFREQMEDQEGFTLIELLVVVIIIGILAAIAIPVFLNQRDNAEWRALEASVSNAAVQAQSNYTTDGDWTQAVADAGTNSDGYAISFTGDQESFCVQATGEDSSKVASQTLATGSMSAVVRTPCGGTPPA